jgi:hypothetical protein
MESHRIHSEARMKAEGPLLKQCHLDHQRINGRIDSTVIFYATCSTCGLKKRKFTQSDNPVVGMLRDCHDWYQHSLFSVPLCWFAIQSDAL